MPSRRDHSGKPPKPRPGKPRPADLRKPVGAGKPPSSAREPAFARAVLEGIADPLVVYAADWTVRYENNAARALFTAMGRGTMIRRNVWTEFPDLVGTTFEREMRRAMEQGVPTSFIEERRATGNWTQVSCYPLPGGGLAAVWRNITSEKRAERAMRYLTRASEVLSGSLDPDVTCNALAQLIVPDLADWCTITLRDDDQMRLVAVAHVDAEKVKLVRELSAQLPKSIDANTASARVMRSGEPELVPQITDEMIDAVSPNAEFRAAIKSLGFSSVLTVPLTVHGRVLGAMSLVDTRSGSKRTFGDADVQLALQLAQRAAIAIDNATHYRAAVEARATAELANSAKSDFLARMSHELRTPLNAIGGYTDLLAMEIRGPLTPEQQEDLRRVKRSQQHLLSLIDDLLSFARIDAGKVEFEIRDVSVADLLAAVDTVFSPQFRKRGLACVLEPVDAALQVRADAEKLQQIVFNLVSNAVKFTPSGSVTIGARQRDGQVEIEVRDTGRGIPPDKLESIFEPFVQLRRSATEPGEGTGLGLAISRELARAMGGDVSVRSSSGQGSTFCVTLPAVATTDR